jgi:UDP-N-acetylglucosamine:LPS N-acetylglucosamine transferase
MMNTAKPTVLILATNTGGGHLNLAQSLQDRLGAGYNVVIANGQSTFDGWFYTLSSRYFVKYLTWQYTWTDNTFASLWLHRVLTLLSRRRIHTIIDRVQPQLIIATHAFLSYATARINESYPRPARLVFQLTDLGRVHMTWFTEKYADAYLAPTREIFAQALEQGIERSRLYLTGRPVRGQFVDVAPGTRDEKLATLGFDPAVLTIFLQGGAKGSADVDQSIENFLSVNVPVQIILAVGNNQKMALRYSGIGKVRTVPFTEQITPYMAAADVIAGKAGASFISEAFMLEKPFLVTAYIPGQETANLHFIEQHNLGWICLDALAQQKVVASLACDPGVLAEKVESIRAYRAWNIQANQRIGPVIERVLSKTNERW